MKLVLGIWTATLFNLLIPSHSFAAEGATLLFREGQVVYVTNGYKQLSEAFKGLSGKAEQAKIVEVSIEGSTFLLNLSEVVLVCRDRCSNLEINDPRRTEKR